MLKLNKINVTTKLVLQHKKKRICWSTIVDVVGLLSPTSAFISAISCLVCARTVHCNSPLAITCSQHK